MNLLILGCGKTGALVATVARERNHDVQVMRAADNPRASGLTTAYLAGVDAVIDFTTPHAVLDNISACARAGRNMVVGTTGWYSELAAVRELVVKGGAGFLYGANFSLGVNLFFEIARASASALKLGYFGQIFERHHVQKKDAPSGTALALQKAIQENSQVELEITSFREGQVVGMHEVVYDSPWDTLYLCHDAKSRRGFAEGAVRGAEWLVGKKGFFNFQDVWQHL